MKKSCRCVDQINKKLEDAGAELDLAFNLKGDVFPQIATARRQGHKRHRIPLVIPSFCPFCGREYKSGGKYAYDLRQDVAAKGRSSTGSRRTA